MKEYILSKFITFVSALFLVGFPLLLIGTAELLLML